MVRILPLLVAIVLAGMALCIEAVAATKKKDQSRLPRTVTQEPQAPPVAVVRKKDQSKVTPPTITQAEAKKICAKKYGLFYRAVVRRGTVICYI